MQTQVIIFTFKFHQMQIKHNSREMRRIRKKRSQQINIWALKSLDSQVAFFLEKKNLLIFGGAGSLFLLRLFSSCGEQRRLSSQGGGLLAAVASAGEQWLSGAWAPVAEARGSGCGSRDLDHRLSSGGARPHRPRHAGSSQTRD